MPNFMNSLDRVAVGFAAGSVCRIFFGVGMGWSRRLHRWCHPLLNVIAGMVPYEDSVPFGDTAVDGLPPARRKVGYLFQSFALFPHMRVRDNIAFGLQACGADPVHIRKRVDGLLRMLNIRRLETRYPKFLSGGEKQRVALARTLAPCPKTLLLDEPFNGLEPGSPVSSARIAGLMTDELPECRFYCRVWKMALCFSIQMRVRKRGTTHDKTVGNRQFAQGRRAPCHVRFAFHRYAAGCS